MFQVPSSLLLLPFGATEIITHSLFHNILKIKAAVQPKLYTFQKCHSYHFRVVTLIKQ